MLKFYALFFLSILFKFAGAHNPQVSTILILEDKNNNWTVLITAPLYTFQLAIKINEPGLDPEKLDPINMQREISNLVKRNFIINNDDHTQLVGERIQIAHESSIFYSISKPEKNFALRSFSFKAFAKLNEHYTLLKIMPYKAAEVNFILSPENKYTFEFNDNKTSDSGSVLLYLTISLLILIISGLIYLFYRKSINSARS